MAEQTKPLIITLWGTYGTGTDEIALKLSEKLGIPLHRGSYSSDDLKDAKFRPEDDPFAGNWYLVQATPPHGRATWRTIFKGVERAEDETRANLEREVKKDAERGGVFIGRNGTYILQGYPNALHVRLDGPIEKRVDRIVARQNISRAQAEEDAHFEDEVRAGMSLNLFDWDPRGNELYDLAVFTTSMDLDTVVEVIAAAAQAKLARG